jgi:hypothetical protein
LYINGFVYLFAILFTLHFGAQVSLPTGYIRQRCRQMPPLFKGYCNKTAIITNACDTIKVHGKNYFWSKAFTT